MIKLQSMETASLFVSFWVQLEVPKSFKYKYKYKYRKECVGANQIVGEYEGGSAGADKGISPR